MSVHFIKSWLLYSSIIIIVRFQTQFSFSCDSVILPTDPENPLTEPIGPPTKSVDPPEDHESTTESIGPPAAGTDCVNNQRDSDMSKCHKLGLT